MFIQELEPTHVAFILNKIIMANSSKKSLDEYWDGQPKRTRPVVNLSRKDFTMVATQLPRISWCTMLDSFITGFMGSTMKSVLSVRIRGGYHRRTVCPTSGSPGPVSKITNGQKRTKERNKNYVKNFRDPGVKEDMSLKSEFTDWTETARSSGSGLGNQSSPPDDSEGNPQGLPTARRNYKNLGSSAVSTETGHISKSGSSGKSSGSSKSKASETSSVPSAAGIPGTAGGLRNVSTNLSDNYPSSGTSVDAKSSETKSSHYYIPFSSQRQKGRFICGIVRNVGRAPVSLW